MTLEIFMNANDTKVMSVPSDASRASTWVWLIAVPPLLAVIGCAITWYFILRYPDHEIPVENVRITTGSGVHQHVVNSVTPPLH
jgi:hypothetical protein